MISIVMSVYNEKLEWLEEAVESILLQTYSDFEFIIVVDNPALPEHLRSYIENKKKQDSRIVVIYNETNLGLALSLNKGISIARGEYIARMDADDIALPERLQCEIDYLEKNGVDMVSTNAIIIDEASREIKKREANPENPMLTLRYSNPIVHPSVLIRSDVIRNVGGYRNFKRSQDYDLWLRLMTSGYQIRIMDAYLMKYRVRSTSITKEGRLEQYYINLYQKRLYKERTQKGTDSFSEDHLTAYLAKKRITQKKNQRCIKCMEYLDQARFFLLHKKFRFVFYFLKAFVSYPSIVLRSIANYINK